MSLPRRTPSGCQKIQNHSDQCRRYDAANWLRPQTPPHPSAAHRVQLQSVANGCRGRMGRRLPAPATERPSAESRPRLRTGMTPGVSSSPSAGRFRGPAPATCPRFSARAASLSQGPLNLVHFWINPPREPGSGRESCPPLYGGTARLKVVPPPPPASTLTRAVPPGRRTIRISRGE